MSTAMARADRNRERGSAKANLVLTLIIMGAMLFAAVKIVPVYFANYEFQDAIESESRFALTGYPKRNQEDVRDEVWRKAQDLGLPAKKDDIRVALANGSVEIGLDYVVPIDLAVYQFTLQFHPHADNHSI
jgi:hypothetical protein